MKSSIFKKMSLFLACLVGVGTAVTAVTLNNQKGNVRVAEATNITYSVNQNQLISGGGSFGIFEKAIMDWDNTLNCFKAKQTAPWMRAEDDNLKYVTRVTINMHVIGCSEGTTTPEVWFAAANHSTDARTLNVEEDNTIIWDIEWDVDPESEVDNVFEFLFNLHDDVPEFIYFTGLDATTPIITIETSVARPKAYITAGTGVDSVFLSNSTDGSNPQPSGTEYNVGANVYAFATLDTEYDPKAAWGDPVSGNTYRVGSFTMGSSDHNFGTINAVAKPIVIPTGLTAKYGDELSSVILPDGWSWKTPNDKVGNVGEREHTAIRNNVEYTLTVTVTKADPTYVVPTDIEAPYDVALSTIGLPEGFSWMDGTQKTSTWGESIFKAKYTPSDTVNYNIVENIDIKVNVKWILVDPTAGDVSVTIDGGDSEFTVDISVKVQIKTEISTEQKRSNYAELGKKYINKNEDIGAIYDVKLIRTIDGVEQEIQPSDIKAGTKILISMGLPNDLIGKSFRLLHIHSSDDVEEISSSKYAVTGDGKTVMLETERLSEFAFIVASTGDNGFIYDDGNPNGGIPGWAIALIIIGSVLLLLGVVYALLFFVFNKWIKKEDKAVRVLPFTLGKKDELFRVMAFPFKCEYRKENEIFKTKKDALK